MLTTSTNLVVLMQNGIVQRSAQSIAGHWQKNSRQVLCSPVPEDLIFHPCERSWKRLSGLFVVFGKSQCVFDLLLLSSFLLIFHCHRCFLGMISLLIVFPCLRACSKCILDDTV